MSTSDVLSLSAYVWLFGFCLGFFVRDWAAKRALAQDTATVQEKK